MKRGLKGLPCRPPADGWPLKYFDGGLYQHVDKSLNGLAKFVNNTQTELQSGQVGLPMSRPTPDQSGGPSCEVHPDNGLPKIPWIGVGANQYLPPILGGTLQNTYLQQGTNDKGNHCRKAGFKNVQAVRQWHGFEPWTYRSTVDCPDTVCSDGSTYLASQPNANQVKYKKCTVAATYDYVGYGDSGSGSRIRATASGYVEVDPLSGKKTHTLLTTEIRTNLFDSGITKYVSGGAGYTQNSDGSSRVDFVNGMTTSLDDVCAADVRCAHPALPTAMADFLDCGSVLGLIYQWNLNFPTHPLPAMTDLDNYDANQDFYAYGDRNEWRAKITFSRTPTVYTLVVEQMSNPHFPDSPTGLITTWLAVTLTLSNENLSSDVLNDVNSLLNYWQLNKDAVYPWRTDSLWQIAPLMSRDEVAFNVSPYGFLPHTVDDYSQSQNTDGTWTQRAWFDPAAYGWSGSPGSATLKQFALSGKILGMPLPDALTDTDSYWYQAGYSFPSKHDFQNFFDYRADVWTACVFTNDCGDSVNFYTIGYGDWLYDAITRTGAQLPHCATQWTNNRDAISKRPYAWLVQGEGVIQLPSGTPPPGYDSFCSPLDWGATRGDALWAQKCAEIVELWPSYNFARAAGADKFSLDENNVYCYADGTITDNLGNALGDGALAGTWGGSSAGGFYTGCSIAGGALVLGTKVFNVPSDWAVESGDTATAFGKMRFPDAPAILGRLAMLGVVDDGSLRHLAVSTCTTLGLSVGSSDYIDICDGNMGLLASNVAVTRISDNEFTVSPALAAIKNAKYIVTHGAPNYEWDDTQRKGDFTVYDWTLDFRTNGENARLSTVTGCDGSPASAPSPNNGYSDFNQTQHELGSGLKFTPCSPMVVCISPNLENWKNGITIPFPATFKFDDRYSALWQAEVEQAMVDPLWHKPHQPCGSDVHDTWKQDDGTCKQPAPNSGGGMDVYYAFPPLVESRVSLPANGGFGGVDAAPALPSPLVLPHGSPVTYPAASDALYPPGLSGFDKSGGIPTASWTFWGFRLAIERASCAPASCYFNYIDRESLPCTSAAIATESTTSDSAPLTGLEGLS